MQISCATGPVDLSAPKTPLNLADLVINLSAVQCTWCFCVWKLKIKYNMVRLEHEQCTKRGRYLGGGADFTYWKWLLSCWWPAAVSDFLSHDTARLEILWPGPTTFWFPRLSICALHKRQATHVCICWQNVGVVAHPLFTHQEVQDHSQRVWHFAQPRMLLLFLQWQLFLHASCLHFWRPWVVLSKRRHFCAIVQEVHA